MKKPSAGTTALVAVGVCAAAAMAPFFLPDPTGHGDRDPAPETAHISFGLPDGSTGVRPSQSAGVSVSGGRLDSVTMEPPAGGGTGGTFSADRAGWTSSGALALDTTYTVHAVARDTGGKVVSRDATFSTLGASQALHATVTPSASATVGVGMPLSIAFDKPVQDEQDVQRAIGVTSTGGQQVVGHWFGRTRLDFRPETFWKPGTTVRVRLALDGVAAAPGIVGVQDKSFDFHVGRAQISTVDAAASTMTVVRSGKTLRELPVTAGDPEHATYNGTMVISSKSLKKRMNGATVGLLDDDGKPAYDIPDVPHAMRLTTSGTFIHGNYWAAPSVFGAANTSHGCIGLQDVKGGGDPNTPAAWFYENSLVGDVVIVKNSAGGGNVSAQNGLNDWNMSWSAWKDGSALA
ncbi:Ig-like domain-containing protein [Streptomyces sp. NPDC086023]|uniref:L,D-transpeptidase n=1 Tax=Streptomyces sp. NPDC086023 TaxID=3365746 RepID=UPI0037CF6D49